MSIAALLGAYSSAAAASAARQARMDANDIMFRATGIYSAKMGVSRPDKCPCCGSREFRPHNHRMICAYCRS